MRSTTKLISELEEEAKQHWVVMMAIGFQNSTIFVQAKDEDRHQLLNSAIRAGGTPVGLIAADKKGNELVFVTRVYPEHQDMAVDADKYLSRLIAQVAKTLSSRKEDH